jgi:hypothetical protein
LSIYFSPIRSLLSSPLILVPSLPEAESAEEPLLEPPAASYPAFGKCLRLTNSSVPSPAELASHVLAAPIATSHASEIFADRLLLSRGGFGIEDWSFSTPKA